MTILLRRSCDGEIFKMVTQLSCFPFPVNPLSINKKLIYYTFRPSNELKRC